jgi:VanZ family protein/glutaredoxin
VHRVTRWGLFGAYLALTILFSSMTRPPVAEAVSDLVLHAIEFTLLAILLIQALGRGLFQRHSGRHLAITAAFGVCYGVADEIHQYFTPGRHSSVMDAVVDAAATLATVGAIALLGAIFGRRAPGQAAGPGDPPRVELLTRDGCHLCEEARDALASELGPPGRGFDMIDVDTSPSLAARYGEQVPVVLVDGIKRFKGRVDLARLRRLLAERPRLRGGGQALESETREAAIES